MIVSFSISFQKSAQLIKQIIASKHIQIEGRNYIFACLYNIGVVLHRNKEAKEVLCYQFSITKMSHVSFLFDIALVQACFVSP